MTPEPCIALADFIQNLGDEDANRLIGWLQSALRHPAGNQLRLADELLAFARAHGFEPTTTPAKP